MGAGIGEKLWGLLCCNSSSTTSPVEIDPPPIELLRQPNPGTSNLSRKKDYDDVIDTVDSIVGFVLKGVQAVGSNLPGIGAVSVVLAAKDKFMTDRENRREEDRIFKYIEDLCEDARLADGTVTPNIDMENARFVETLQRDFARQKKSKGWHRALDVIKADGRKEDLEAVWKGIERAMKRHGLKVTTNAAKIIESVYQRVLEMDQKIDAVRRDQLVQLTMDKGKALEDLLSRLEIAKGAKFNSMRTEQTRLVTCTAETRVGVLRAIEDWAMSTDDGRERLFWLNGLAGTGKSTIASTVAKWADGKKLLGGSFFFSRGVPELSSPALVFPTLASQLAEFDAEYERALYYILKGNRFSANANLEVQFDTFIRKPFSACREKRSILIMLDALDECSPELDVYEMLRLLLQYDAVGSGGTKLRIFVTSRPESHIRSVFTSQDGTDRHEEVILHDIDRTTVHNDIATYLKAEFAKMSSNNSRFERKPPKDWPSSNDFEKLLSNCGEFFAYAATVVRFIGDAGISDPASQFADILLLMEGEHVGSGLNPYHTLDSLYLAVLDQAACKDPREGSVARLVHIIATVLCLRSPMHVPDLALFLGMKPDDVRYTLRHLHSVILVPDYATVQFFHQSFPDFLKDQKRCPSDKGFLIDIAEHERSMASRCIDLNGLHGVELYRSVLSYAAENWKYHFRLGTHPDTRSSDKRSLWPVTTGNELTEEIARLEREPQAEFDKPWSERTRRGVLDAVRDWITKREEEQKHLFWLYGWADRGCPDIGMYITKWARDERIPGACITFHHVPFLGMQSVFPFLASQLARSNPEYRSALYSIIQGDQKVHDSEDYHLQFETLIREPMASSTRHENTIEQPILLVLNAYNSEDSYIYGIRLRFLWALLHKISSSLMGPNLRVLVVCTPRSTFRALLNPRVCKSPVISYGFDECIDRVDIRTFFERRLQKHKDARSNEQLEKLLDCCGTSFTFARPAFRFVFDKEVDDPDGQLREIWNVNERLHASVDDTCPRPKLDNLYRLILQQAASNNTRNEDIERMRCYIATIICLRRADEYFLSSGLPVSILSMEEDAVRRQLRCVEGESEGDLYGFLHPSFEEFIQDKERCTDSRFLVDARAHERFMALQCCRKLQAGERQDTFDYAYHYSFAHWPSHLQSAMFHDPSGDLMQELDLSRVVSDKTMLANSYSGQVVMERILLGEHVDIIPFVRELVEKYQPNESETILALLRDAEADEFVARCRKVYLSERRRLLREGGRQIHSGDDGDS